jgi:ABC-type transport system involved in cytochrome c biogenesis permease subunit
VSVAARARFAHGCWRCGAAVASDRDGRTAWIAVIGFLLALFTFAEVNFLIRGLHSYA